MSGVPSSGSSSSAWSIHLARKSSTYLLDRIPNSRLATRRALSKCITKKVNGSRTSSIKKASAPAISTLKDVRFAPAYQMRSTIVPEMRAVWAKSTSENAETLLAKNPSPAARSGWYKLSWRGKPRTRHKNRYQRNIRKYQRKRRNRNIGRLTKAYQYPALLRKIAPSDFAAYQVRPERRTALYKPNGRHRSRTEAARLQSRWSF